MKEIYPYISQDPLGIHFIELGNVKAFMDKNKLELKKTIVAYDSRIGIGEEIPKILDKFEE